MLATFLSRARRGEPLMVRVFSNPGGLCFDPSRKEDRTVACMDCRRAAKQTGRWSPSLGACARPWRTSETGARCLPMAVD